jgi:hypothetical protein
MYFLRSLSWGGAVSGLLRKEVRRKRSSWLFPNRAGREK